MNGKPPVPPDPTPRPEDEPTDEQHDEAARRLTAYHEASHAVAARALGTQVDRVTIRPGRDYSGSCQHTDDDATDPATDDPLRPALDSGPLPEILDALDLERHADELEGSAIASLAGYHGEARANRIASRIEGRPVFTDEYLDGNVGDREHARRVAAELAGLYDGVSPADILKDLDDWARDLVGDHWRAIERVARELRRRVTLTGREIDDLIADVPIRPRARVRPRRKRRPSGGGA